jgi:hypothetical protein
MHHHITGFENCHLHTDFSLLDGTGMVQEYATQAPKINQRFLCVTDHGMMGAVPSQIKACEEHGIHPIFGAELYVHPNQPEILPGQSMPDFVAHLPEVERKKMRKTFHLTAIAYTTEGYENLVQLTSWGWLRGFYYRPRVNHEQLIKHREGIIFLSGCYNGEIGQAFDNAAGRELRGEGPDEAAAMVMVEKYMAMFGENFYLEMMLLDFHKQKPYDIFLQKVHAKYGIPVVVTQDCHYCKKEDSLLQRNMLMIQTNTSMQDLEEAKAKNADLFELQDHNLWMKSEDELNQFWESRYVDDVDYDLFKQAKANTVLICERAKGVELDRSIKLPKLPDENDVLKEEIFKGFRRRQLPMTKEYSDRLKEEYSLICDKEFSSYFLIEQMMTDEARRVAPEILGFGDGSEAVGPGRGSACGSLVCYCLGITDVNPIPHGLLFSRFLSPARGGKSMKVRFMQKPVGVEMVTVVEELDEKSGPDPVKVEFGEVDMQQVYQMAKERHAKRSGRQGNLDAHNLEDIAVGILAELACERLGLGFMDKRTYDGLGDNVTHDLYDEQDVGVGHVKAKRPLEPGWLLSKHEPFKQNKGEPVFFCNSNIAEKSGVVYVLGFAWSEEVVPIIKLPYVPSLQAHKDGLWKKDLNPLLKSVQSYLK